MATSKAKTVRAYLDELPADRRRELEKVRRLVRKHMPRGYKESMQFGMIGWGIPLSRYPDTYNGQPLAYVALAAQKNYNALYLMVAYANKTQLAKLKRGFKTAGKKLDMGKSCIRFKKADDLALETVGEVVASTSVDAYLKAYERARR